MIFFIYRPIQIFFENALLCSSVGLLASFTAEHFDISSSKSFTADSMLSFIEKHTTSLKSGISIKCFNFEYLFINNDNVKAALRERVV